MIEVGPEEFEALKRAVEDDVPDPELVASLKDRLEVLRDHSLLIEKNRKRDILTLVRAYGTAAAASQKLAAADSYGEFVESLDKLQAAYKAVEDAL